MKVLIAGDFNETAKSNIVKHFPPDWDIVIVRKLQ